MPSALPTSLRTSSSGQVRLRLVQPQLAGVLGGGEQDLALLRVFQVGLVGQRQIELGVVLGLDLDRVAPSSRSGQTAEERMNRFAAVPFFLVA